MPATVKTVRRPPPGRSSYLRAALKGMSLTFRHMVNPNKVTQQYPEEQTELHPRWRGTHRMEVHADGRPKCVAFENAEYTRDRFVYDLDRLMAQEHSVTALWDPSDPLSE
jgi:hypothetical protein